MTADKVAKNIVENWFGREEKDMQQAKGALMAFIEIALLDAANEYKADAYRYRALRDSGKFRANTIHGGWETAPLFSDDAYKTNKTVLDRHADMLLLSNGSMGIPSS